MSCTGVPSRPAETPASDRGRGQLRHSGLARIRTPSLNGVFSQTIDRVATILDLARGRWYCPVAFSFNDHCATLMSACGRYVFSQDLDFVLEMQSGRPMFDARAQHDRLQESDTAQIVSFARRGEDAWLFVMQSSAGDELLDECARSLEPLDRADHFALDPAGKRLLAVGDHGVVLRDLQAGTRQQIDLSPLIDVFPSRDLAEQLGDLQDLGWAALSVLGHPAAIASCTTETLRVTLQEALLEPIEVSRSEAARLRERLHLYPAIPRSFVCSTGSPASPPQRPPRAAAEVKRSIDDPTWI